MTELDHRVALAWPFSQHPMNSWGNEPVGEVVEHDPGIDDYVTIWWDSIHPLVTDLHLQTRGCCPG